MKIKSYSKGNQTIFIIDIPIVEIEDYVYYHMYSLPVPFQSSFSTIIPKSKYLLSNEKSYAFTDNKCEEISTEEFICEDIHTRKIKENAPCEIQLINYMKNIKTCKRIPTKVPDIKVQKLEKNQWIVITPNNTVAVQKCGKDKTNIPLNGTYIIELNNDCEVFIKDIIIKTFVNTKNKFENIQLPKLQFFMEPEIKEDFKFDANKLETVNLNDLNNIYSALNNQKQKLSNIGDDTIHFHKVSGYTILLYTGVTVLAIYIGYKQYLKKKLQGATKPEEHPVLPAISRSSNSV